MKETDLIRRQLDLERTHLREVLDSGCREPTHAVSQAEARYCAAATACQIRRLTCHLELLPARLTDAGIEAPQEALAQLDRRIQAAAASLIGLDAALAAAPAGADPEKPEKPEDWVDLTRLQEAFQRHVPPAQGLIDAWSEELEELAGRSYRTEDWRRAAHLSADSVLEERQRHAEARAALDADAWP